MNHRSDHFGSARFVVAAIAIATVAACAKAPQSAVGDEIDARSYHLGSISSWSEAVGAGIKELALSSPAAPDEMDDIAAAAEDIAAQHGVSVYRETEFLVTDLFSESLTDGKHVLLLYRGSTLDRYRELKNKKAALVESGEYSGVARESIAREFGRLLSYPESNIDERLANSGKKVLLGWTGRPSMNGIWKAPTVALDDPRWRIEDAACLNGCSLVAYHYFHELLIDPQNDDRSVVDLYAEVNEFNEDHIALITTHKTLEQRTGYDAAYDAALDCNPDGDGLQHQITAPPPIEIEEQQDKVIIRYEYWNAVRTVHLGNRHAPVDVTPTRLGYSFGRYEGSTLVIDTSYILPSQIRLGERGAGKFFLSDNARFIERYTVDETGDRLDIEWSVIDPVHLREPYTGKVALLSAPGWELDEFVCEAITGEF